MLALEFPDVRGFMEQLLRGETFDAFQVRSAQLQTQARFDIDGRCGDAYVLWAWLRPYFFALIKGKTRPRRLKLVFAADAGLLACFEGAAACFLNLTYEGDCIRLSTGCTAREFSLDRRLDSLWDDYVKDFLKTAGLSPLSRL